jgi:hypothetical protein
MGEPRTPKPVRLVMSLIMNSEAILPRVVEDLEGYYGETAFVSPSMAFDFTDYYAPEMGTDLRRRFIAFRDLIPPEALSSVKHQTNRLELRYAHQRTRRVNIDPGYLSGAHLILATTKAYAHRPYLDDGIYADLTLVYRQGSYRPLEWTYPDYRKREIVEMFNMLRKTYLRQLNERTESKNRS